MGKVMDMFCSLVRFKGGLRGRTRFNSVIMDVITGIIYRCTD